MSTVRASAVSLRRMPPLSMPMSFLVVGRVRFRCLDLRSASCERASMFRVESICFSAHTLTQSARDLGLIYISRLTCL